METPADVSPRRRTAARRWVGVLLLPVLLLVAGGATAVVVAERVSTLDAAGADRARRDQVEDDAAALRQTMQLYLASVGAVADGVGSNPTGSDRDVRAVAGSLDELPGVTSTSLVVPVPRTAVAVEQAQQRWQAQLGTGLVLAPAPGSGEEHLFVVSQRTVDGLSTAPGTDVSATPELAAATALARRSGQVVASAPFVSTADQGLPGDAAFSVFLAAPVVVQPGQPDAGAFLGWVGVTVRVMDVVRFSLGEDPARGQGAVLEDVTDATDPALLAHGEGWDEAGPGAAAVFDVGNRRWRAHVGTLGATAPRELGAGPMTALVVGGSASLLLALLVLSATTRRARAERQVEAATASLAVEVADRRRTEQALRTRQAELEAYTTVVADRLRLPLAQLTRTADAARDPRTWTEAERAGQLDRVETRLGAASRLVDDLLLYARCSEVEVVERVVDLAAIAQSVCDAQTALTLHLPEELQPRFEVGALPEVVGEPWLLQEVLLRLVDNAVVHAPVGRGAQVRVSADLTGSRYRGEVWRVEVADRGLGVPRERLARLFDPFGGEDSDVDLGGNHLSLAIVRRVVRRLGGEVGHSDDPRGGSVFWFTLPVRATAGRGPSVTAAVERPALSAATAVG